MNREDRHLVQTLLNVNMVVEAGAGTGKTTLLIDRLCLCVLVQQIAVEKLVSLTFTDKAAAEIKTRFIFKLQHLIQAVRSGEPDRTLELLRTQFSVPDEELVRRAEAALARLDRASIGTIHSFCAEILKTFPLEASLSPQAQIDTGQKEARLFESHWNSFLDEELGEYAPHKDKWKQVLAEISLEELKEFAYELARTKPVEYEYFSHRKMLASVCAEKAARANQLVAQYVLAGKKPRALEKALMWTEMSLKCTEAFLRQTQLPPEPEEACPALPATIYKDWDEHDFDEARALVSFAQKVTPAQQAIFLTAYELLAPLAAQVRRVCEEEGVLGFDDLIIKTRNLLRDNLYVRRLLKEKFEVLFIDEFQDTDPVQGELLLFLAEDKAGAASRWQEVQLQPGKLVVVGDPKQSIYRFRGADITAYELFTQLILQQGGKKCYLRRNFRSTPEIIEAANQICSRAMVQETAFQPAYEPIFTPDITSTKAVEWLFVKAPENEKPGADDFRHNQVEAIARWIREHVGKMLLKDGRVLEHKDIALLMRAGTTTRIYTDALRRHSIAFNTEMDKDFFRKQEINDLWLLLRVVADNGDKIALAGVLRSPFGGLTDEELYQISQQGLTLAHLETLSRTAACAAQLKRFTQLAGRVSLKQLVETILAESFLPEACAAAYDGERSLAYLHQFAQLAAAYEAEHGATLTSFLSDMQTQLAEHPDETGLPPLDEAADGVSILTVHKSKGLEFPVVILADLSRKESGSSARAPQHLFSWQYGLYGLRAGPVCDVNLAFLEEEQKKHSRCEEVRILYVALTRAKEKLVLVADGRTGAAKAAVPFAAAGLLPDGEQPELSTPGGELVVPVQYVPYQAPQGFIYNHFGEKPTEDRLSTEAVDQWRKSYQDRMEKYQQVRQQRVHTPSASEGVNLLTEEQRRGAELGTVCHRALELLVSGKETDVSTACTRAAQVVGAVGRAAEAATVVAPFVASPVFTRIQSARLLACEMPFSVPLADGTVQSGTMDVVLEQPDGSIWIIDYKTDRVRPGGEEALFAQKYRTQLMEYDRAARQIFPNRSVRCTAVFVRTFAAVEL